MRGYQVLGLGWGDESKGAVCDKLCRELPVDLIVRFNGASQAAHNVVTPEGVHHTFSQFGSGMLASHTVRTHLSRFMLVNPLSMMNEAKALIGKTFQLFDESPDTVQRDFWNRITVDKRSVIITPFHRLINQRRERARGENRHGSCGVGVGVAREWQLAHGDAVLYAGDCLDYSSLKRKLKFLRNLYCEEVGEYNGADEPSVAMLAHEYMNWPARIVDGLEPAECMVFEGAQGVLLDEKYGAPHNTWTNTTFENADTLLDEIGCTDRYRIGCLRTYHTRHGAGPFPTEDNTLDLPELHNGTGEFQGAFRVGHFDVQSAKKAINFAGHVDGLAISHLDYLDRLPITVIQPDFIRSLTNALGIPVVMKANGPTAVHRTLELGVYA